MNNGAQDIAAVLALPGDERYRHFITRVADTEEVWGLYEDGWAMAGIGEGVDVFPLWPSREYAQLCAKGVWAGYEARAMSLDDLLDDFLPSFKSEGTLPAIFFTPEHEGVVPSVEQLEQDIAAVLGSYE